MALNLTVLSCRAIHLPLMCHMTMAQVSLQGALNGFFHLNLAFSEFAKLIFPSVGSQMAPRTLNISSRIEKSKLAVQG